MPRRVYLSFAVVAGMLGCGWNGKAPDRTSARVSAPETIDRVPASPEYLGNALVVASGETPAESPEYRENAVVASGETPAGGDDQFFPAGRAMLGSSSTMIIRTGQAYVRVDSLEPALTQLRRLALRTGGYVANSTIQNGSGQVRSATLELKMPADRYDDALGGLSGIGRVLSSSTTAQDVGEEYVDVNARMENARRLEERLTSLLAGRTGKLSDVLSVERELARVREEIERYQGRLRYLKSHAEVSTLAITVSEPPPIVSPGTNPLAEAVRQAWRNFVTLLAGGIAALGVVLPVGVLGIGGILLWRRLRRPAPSQA